MQGENIRLGQLGGGQYDENVFEDKIYGSCVDQDWWIDSTAYAKLLVNIRDVDHTYNINYIPKDLPANPGVRFPGPSGILGGPDYRPLRFVRVGPQLRAWFVTLVNISNWPREEAAGGANKAQRYGTALESITATAVPSYNRQKFESEFGLVLIDLDVGADKTVD